MYFVEFADDGEKHYFKRDVTTQTAHKISEREYTKELMRGNRTQLWATVQSYRPLEVNYYFAGRREVQMTAEEFWEKTQDSPNAIAKLLEMFLSQKKAGGNVPIGAKYLLTAAILAAAIENPTALFMPVKDRKKCIELKKESHETDWSKQGKHTELSFWACLGADCEYVLQFRDMPDNEQPYARERLMERLTGLMPKTKDTWICQIQTQEKLINRQYVMFHGKHLQPLPADYFGGGPEKVANRKKLMTLVNNMHLQRVVIGLPQIDQNDFVLNDKGDLLLWNLSQAKLLDQIVEKPAFISLVTQAQMDDQSPSELIAKDINCIYSLLGKTFPGVGVRADAGHAAAKAKLLEEEEGKH